MAIELSLSPSSRTNPGKLYFQKLSFLPDSLIIAIFSFLSAIDLSNAIRTSQKIRNLGENNQLWKKLYAKDIDPAPFKFSREIPSCFYYELYTEQIFRYRPLITTIAVSHLAKSICATNNRVFYACLNVVCTINLITKMREPDEIYPECIQRLTIQENSLCIECIRKKFLLPLDSYSQIIIRRRTVTPLIDHDFQSILIAGHHILQFKQKYYYEVIRTRNIIVTLFANQKGSLFLNIHEFFPNSSIPSLNQNSCIIL